MEHAGFGFNVFGFLSGSFGLGVTARAYVRLLRESGLPVWPVDVLAGSARSAPDVSFPEKLATLTDPAPYPVNLFIMNAGDLARVIGTSPPAVQSWDRVNCALPFWELSEVPAEAVSILEAFDIVFAGSRFNYDSYARQLSGPMVRYVPHPLYLESEERCDRTRWGLRSDATVFLMSFDMASDVNRKNPFGAIEAFQRAFPSSDDMTLLIKVNGTHLDEAYGAHLAELEGRAARDGRIRLIDEVLPYADVLSLYQSCDAYVSLHRAEGLGLCLLESMWLGKPVIATAWSGNMEFMTDQNSCLVGCSFVPVQGSTQEAYRRQNICSQSRWAEPDLEQAARWMRRLGEDRELRRRIGARAAADIVKRQAGLDPGALVGAVRAYCALNPRPGMSPALEALAWG